MKRKIRWSAGFCLVMSVFFLMTMFETAYTKDLKYAHPNAPGTTVGRFANDLSKLVKERTNNQINIKVFPNSQLGGKDEMIDGVKVGTIEMGHNDYAAYSRLYDDLAVFNVPYLYRDANHALKAISQDSPLIKKMNDKLIKEVGIRMIGNAYYGTRMLTCNTPVYKPEDLRGKKIRAIPTPIWIAMVEGMGAIPTPVDFAELPTALATGIVQGQENPLTTIYNNKFYQMQKYLMLTSHMQAFLVVVINEKVWQGLTQDQRKIILDSSQETSKNILNLGIKEEDELIGKLRAAGMNIIGEKEGLDLKAFRDRVLNHSIQKFPQWAEYIKEIQDIK